MHNHWEHRVYSLGYRVFGYASSPVPYTAFGYTKKNNNDINLGYITIGEIELSALTGYRIVGYAVSVHTQPLGTLAVKYILPTLCYTTAGFTNDDIDLGCITIRNISSLL